jgi:hypothetical protein
VVPREALRRTTCGVAVPMTISDEWLLAVVYPVVPTEVLEDGLDGRIQWNVCTRQHGSLITLDPSLDIWYLFWEAEYVFYSHATLSAP